MRRNALLVVATVLGLVVAVPVSPASADAACDLYASPAGSDANPGTQAQPKQSPIALLNALAPGQDGCLLDGANFPLGGGAAITATAGTAGNPKTLRPATPGARATITTTTGFWLQLASHDLVFKDLDIRRLTGTGGGSLLMVDGDRITLDGVDLTYPSNICLDVGDDPRAGAMDPVQDLVVRRSRIHHCGSAYGAPHFPNDSGVHGIYLQFLRDSADADAYSAILEDNVIVDNHNRGIQLYPDVDDALIQFNVLDGNGANVNIGSERDDGISSERNRFENNVISDSVLDGLTPGGFVGDTSEILGNFPAPGVGVPDFGNVVTGNCIRNATYPAELYEGYGFTHAGNLENVDPQYVDAAAGDYRLAPGSPCAGKGPRPAAGVPTCHGLAATITAAPFTGTAGPDVIVGTAGNDTISGLGGDDVVCGGEGFDTLAGGPGDDLLDGEGGGDGVEYAASATGVTVDLAAQTATGEGSDTLVSISEAYGSTHRDVLLGSNSAAAGEILFGNAGDDLLDGRGGPDTLTGFTGNDELVGGPGGDVLSAGAGDDVVRTRDGGADQVACGTGADRPFTEPGDAVNADCELARRSDFNGDGLDDLAVGVPGESLGSIEAAGVVQVFYGTADGLTTSGHQTWSQNSGSVADQAEVGDGFGQVVAAGDVDGDGFDDLVIGVPREDVGSAADAGAVHVLRGSDTGLTTVGSQLFTQGTPDVPDAVEAGDEFGAALALGTLTPGDPAADLVIGVPGEDFTRGADAGAVSVLLGGAGGLTATGAQLWSQDSAGIGNAVEAGDRFGAALAAGQLDGAGGEDVAIGVPLEDYGTVPDAGTVHVLAGAAGGLTATGQQELGQSTGAVLDSAEPGDRFGAALAVGDLDGAGAEDLAVGAPGEDLGAIDGGGVVQVLPSAYGALTTTGQQLWSQNVAGIADGAEAGDALGSALAAGDIDEVAGDDLVIGVPGESFVGAEEAGAVHVLRSAAGGLAAAGSAFWHQGAPGVPDTNELGDGFGATVAVAWLDPAGADVVVGVPGEDNGAVADGGALQVLPGGGTAGAQAWSQGTPGVADSSEAGDLFGAALAG